VKYHFEMNSGSLNGLVISVTGNFDREKISAAIRRAGGRVDALVHKKVDFVVADEGAIEQNTQRIRKAIKFDIPIVSEKLIIESLKAGRLVDFKPFLLTLPTSFSQDSAPNPIVSTNQKKIHFPHSSFAKGNNLSSSGLVQYAHTHFLHG
jgi:hypothetical protein